LFITIWNTAKILNQTAQGNAGHGHEPLESAIENGGYYDKKPTPQVFSKTNFIITICLIEK